MYVTIRFLEENSEEFFLLINFDKRMYVIKIVFFKNKGQTRRSTKKSGYRCHWTLAIPDKPQMRSLPLIKCS